MDKRLSSDKEKIGQLLLEMAEYAGQIVAELDTLSVDSLPSTQNGVSSLPARGAGASAALRLFDDKYRKGMPASTGPRYFGFVVGGNTPAALVGDWLATVYDVPAIGSQNSATQIEQETIAMLRELFGLSASHFGSFVSGATMSNFVGLALGRQWIARQVGINMSADGLYSLKPITVLSATPHSCIHKAMSMLGMGKKNLIPVATMMDREAIDLGALEQALATQKLPCIVVANAGTVNSCDFDDLEAILELKQRFQFWLHVDAAFGAFAACSPRFKHLVDGLDGADSLAIDAHKWLNVPYDSALQFTRHLDLQTEVFQNSGDYLAPVSSDPGFIHVTPENSRRLRALPAWFSLQAYGSEGYRNIVENSCDMAMLLGEKINMSPYFRLLVPVRLNCVCFSLDKPSTPSQDMVSRYLAALRDTGKTFMTPTIYKGQAGIRAAFSNWRTTKDDVEITWQAMLACFQKLET